MKTNPPVDYERKSTCRNSIRELFVRKPLLERIGPVLGELNWTIQGQNQPDPSKRPLPAYCYNVFKLLRKTYFKVLPEPARCALRDPNETDWQGVGRMIGAGLSCLCHSESDLKLMVERKQLRAEEAAPVVAMIEAIPWDAGAKALWDALLVSGQAAQRCSLKAMESLAAGMQTGVRRFINQDGELMGESARANVYWCLLLVWPEIQEMLAQHPPMTRTDFSRWLAPFADCGLVSVTDLDYLSDVCDDIGLKFKARGAPKKK